MFLTSKSNSKPNFVTQPLAVMVASALLAGCAYSANSGEKTSKPLAEMRVTQEEGKVTYWVLPGPRKLDRETFGTPDNPKMLLEPKIKAAMQAKGPATVPELLKQVPIIVAAPQKARKVMPNGDYVFAQPTPFSNDARIIEGSFEATFTDMVETDPPGKPGQTPDTAEFTAEFSDPQGNEYRVVLDHVVKPPFPGYETQGGVMLDSVHHGTTGTGSPLMPEVDTVAALWGVGELHINGELVDDHRVMHLMTSEVVRNKDYELVHTRDLPLAPEERHINGQEHHTHLMLPPIKATGKGPVFSPVPTAFELPNGKNQPFLHIMFEQDEVERL
ncbi:hypothetical protein FDP08_13390 [Marinobacter panjinensis]|uniref:Uncharacterized protein n=1 Tax=Marinobacter panjinensis TaxID=2576384 RepID=A0A4U6R594_9GAMM|nr:hypothetical protein [Marinobacter panjinensis]MCR8914127.1 hypothetical protein [Marinobacter panjinensis]TKV69014.1 hypothetical protein FDP08_13390 [Marinobacter panjinensis]